MREYSCSYYPNGDDTASDRALRFGVKIIMGGGPIFIESFDGTKIGEGIRGQIFECFTQALRGESPLNSPRPFLHITEKRDVD